MLPGGSVLPLVAQELQRGADRLLAPIAGDALEGGVHVADLPVRPAHDDHLRRLPDRGGQEGELLLRPPPLADVAGDAEDRVPLPEPDP
jgi:hypothetical protein